MQVHQDTTNEGWFNDRFLYLGLLFAYGFRSSYTLVGKMLEAGEAPANKEDMLITIRKINESLIANEHYEVLMRFTMYADYLRRKNAI